MGSQSPKSGKRGRTGLHQNHHTGPRASTALVTVTCQTCGTPRTYLASALRVRKAIKFCSQQCAGVAFRKQPTLRTCPICSRTFSRLPGHKQTYCSATCATQARRTSRSRLCPQCGVGFTRRPRDKRKYCCAACAHAAARRLGATWPLPANSSREAFREYHQGYRDANREAVNQSAARSRARRRDILREDRRWRLALLRTGPKHLVIQKRLEQAGGFCVYCGRPAKALEVDHFDPLSKGGSIEISNIIPCCRWCNASKGNSNPADWIADRHGIPGLARVVKFLEDGSVPTWLNSPLKASKNGIDIEEVS